MPTPRTDPDYSPSLEELLSDLRQVSFYLMKMTPTQDWKIDDSFGESLREHLLWLRHLELSDVLVLSGPCDLDTWDGTGVAVLRAAPRDEALALAITEPFHLRGMRHNTIQHWQVNEGTLHLSVSMLTGKIVVR
jgi:uncharacterized protein